MTPIDELIASLRRTARQRLENPDLAIEWHAADALARLKDALIDVRKLAMDDHWSPPNQCWAIATRIDEALQPNEEIGNG